MAAQPLNSIKHCKGKLLLSWYFLHRAHIDQNFNTITLTLSLLPFIFAYLTKVEAIVLACSNPLHKSTAFWSSQTSQRPSEAITRKVGLFPISIYSISGTLETPSDFNYRSPRALVTAKDPDTLPLIMKPPYFLNILNYTWFFKFHFELWVCDQRLLFSHFHLH